MAKITASIVRTDQGKRSRALWVEASNGQTYIRVIDTFPKRAPLVMYSAYRTGSRDPDAFVKDRRKIPHAVRALMQANPTACARS